MNPAFPVVPIHYCALVGALALLWLRVLTPREAYASVDWQVLLMLYGPGGYKFTDFLRVGIPLNIICWIVACTIIPIIWPF